MKQITFTFLFALYFGVIVNAQSFSLVSTSGNTIQNGDTITVVDTAPNASFNVIVWLTNNSLSTKYVKAMRTQISIVNGSENYFCWGSCYDTATYVSLDSVRIESKQTEKGFSGDYNSNGNIGKSLIKYTFFDVANNSDKIEFYVEYIAGSGVGINDVTNEYMLSNAFPNPAKNQFTINYDIKGAKKARIEILNVIGSKVENQEIPVNSNSASINISSLKNGVYFYNVIVDGRRIESKKLIIQR